MSTIDVKAFAMSDEQLERVIGKARKLNELRRAKDRVRQLERELRGESAKPAESTYVPEFRRRQATRGLAILSAVPPSK